MMITGVFFFLALFSFHVLDIKPVARSEVVDKMSDLYLVVDAKDRLVDFNRATEEKLGLKRGSGIGRELRSFMPANPGFFERLNSQSDFVEELEGLAEGDQSVYEASVSGLANRERPETN